jgi:hypothetical protein
LAQLPINSHPYRRVPRMKVPQRARNPTAAEDHVYEYNRFIPKKRPTLPTDIVRREINSILFDSLIDGIPRVNVEMNVRRKAAMSARCRKQWRDSIPACCR